MSSGFAFYFAAFASMCVIGLGLSLSAFRQIAAQRSWPLGELTAQSKATAPLIGIVSVCLGLLSVLLRHDEATAGALLIGGLSFALLWTVLLRSSASVAQLVLPFLAVVSVFDIALTLSERGFPRLGAISAAQAFPLVAGLVGALAFGTGDFCGGRAAIQLNGLCVVAIAQVTSAATGLSIFHASSAALPVGRAQSLAILAGAFHVTAVYFLYQGMARGRISVVAPIAAVVGIAVPVVTDMVFVDNVAFVHLAGILIAVAAILLITDNEPNAEVGDASTLSISIRHGALSGLGYGFADLCLGVLEQADAKGALAIARLTGALLTLVALLLIVFGRYLRSQARRPAPISSIASLGVPAIATGRIIDRGLAIAIGLGVLAGVLDCIGQLGYVLSATSGQMSIAAALVALYPAVSVALAVWFLKEHIHPVQRVGLAAGLVSIIFLTR